MDEKKKEIEKNIKNLMIIYMCHVNDDAQLSNWKLFHDTMNDVESYIIISYDYFFF